MPSFSIKWILGLVIATLITMVMIYVIKKTTKKYDIPVLNKIVEEV